MRKSLSVLLLSILAACFTLNAQQADVLEQVRSDVRKSYGMEGPHRLDEMGPLSKAPCGYKPFYISHYGRHGSRYAWNSKTYTIIHETLQKAAEAGALTPYGEELRTKYEAFYMEPWINSGDLVPLGFEQHEAIGRFAVKNFPQVFKADRTVQAISSTAQRSIVSMGAFTLGLKSGSPRLRITQNSNHVGMKVAAPPSVHKSLVRHFKGENEDYRAENPSSFRNRTVPQKEVLDKLFTDCSFISGEEATTFASQLWQLYCGYHNYESEPLFDDLLTDEQRVQFWEADNYSSWYSDLTARWAEIPLLEDIVTKASEAFRDNTKAADLRFGHDYVLEALACLMDLDGCGKVPQKPEDVKYCFQNYNIPMAATLMMVFYRNGKGDILVKAILNEREVTIGHLTPVKGYYYRWSDFMDWYGKMRSEHPEL